MRNRTHRASTIAVLAHALLAWLIGPCPTRGAEDPQLPACAPGWAVEVVAAAPRILHPTAVACAPDGRVFVCEDRMDMSGPVDRPVNRLLCVHPDGRITVFAERIYAAFGMEYIDGKLYVHHSPRFSVFRDGGERGLDRTDLIETTNPAPWGSSVRGRNQINDHAPAGFQLGVDGFLYIAVGDKGIYGMVGRDGRKLELPLGGVIRMRPDGTGPETFATGFRTVLNPALNAEGAIFLYDNNDHLNFHKVAVGLVVEGGYYGYPWDYRPPRPAYVLPMDVRVYEGGAPTGILAYEEDGLPEPYRGNLLLCDWGRQEVVRLTVARRGAAYRAVAEERLLRGRIRPTGIASSPDGSSFYIGDWQYPGWREDVAAGRLLRLTYRGKRRGTSAPKPSWYHPAAMGRDVRGSTPDLIEGLGHPSRSVRMVSQRRLVERGREAASPLVRLVRNPAAPRPARWHAIWALDALDAGRGAILDAVDDPDPSVRIQAIRELGTRQVVAARDRLLARGSDPDAAVRLEVVTALGRLGLAGTVPALRDRLDDDDPLVRYAAFTAMNRVGRADPAAWEGIVEGLASAREPVRLGSALAVRETYDPALVAALAGYAGRPSLPGSVRAAAGRALFALGHRPPEWDGVWWRLGPLGYLEDSRDARPALPKTRTWGGTASVVDALHRALDDPDPQVRGAALEWAETALDRGTISRLVRLFDDPAATTDRPAILRALGTAPDHAAAGPILAVLREPARHAELISTAVAAAARHDGPAIVEALADLARADLPAPDLVGALATLGELRVVAAIPTLAARLRHRDPGVRGAAAGSLGRIGGDPAARALLGALDDPDAQVRREVVAALGSSRAKSAVPGLLRAYRNPPTRLEALGALCRLPDPRALDAYLDGLTEKDAGLRAGCRAALANVGDPARRLIRARLASGTLPGPVVLELASLYGQDASFRPLFATAGAGPKPGDYLAFALANRGDPRRGRSLFADPGGAGCIKCHRVGGEGGDGGPDLTHVAGNYGRTELIESILAPSKKVAAGYRLTTIATADGAIRSGVVLDEKGGTVTLADSQGRKHAIRQADIDQRSESDSSPMPEGLYTALTRQEFTDLVAYLESLR
jgi:putative heme-binding domain-containing protein